MSKAMITQARLKELLHYDPDTGLFTWRRDQNNRAKKGTIAGTKALNKYVRISIDGRIHLAHRLAWLWMTGAPPAFEIDHRDGCKHNNVFSNLRDIEHGANQQNQRKPQSASGYIGVTWDARTRKYMARLQVAGRRVHIGRFSSAEQAHLAYVQAKRQHHPFSTI